MAGADCGQRKPDAAAQTAHRQDGFNRRGHRDRRGQRAPRSGRLGAQSGAELQSAELAEILRKTIQGLPQGFRIVFVLRDVEDFSTEETAETLGLSIPAVKSRLLACASATARAPEPLFSQEEGVER